MNIKVFASHLNSKNRKTLRKEFNILILNLIMCIIVCIILYVT
nr:MAG TPA_asm: hypothetical protein [Caudoviricetes sp.]